MAVVKADAYGHGIEAVADVLSDQVEMFAVASLNEALCLQQNCAAAAAAKDIFLLGPALPGEYQEVIDNNLIAPISNLQEAESFNRLAAKHNTRQRVHLAIDTGMGRIGTDSDNTAAFFDQVKVFENLSIEGLFSHFPCADESDESFTLAQIGQFKQVSELFHQHYPAAKHIHIANSAGLLRFAEQLDFTTVARSGLALYGVAPGGYGQAQLKPAMTLKTRITLIRELPCGQSISYGRTFTTNRRPTTRVATLSVGYGDGYLRQLSGKGAEVLITGQRCPLLGTITMDQIMVDVSDLTISAKVGDEAILLGSQGDEQITALEMAGKADTIAWQVFTSISKRVKRVYD